METGYVGLVCLFSSNCGVSLTNVMYDQVFVLLTCTLYTAMYVIISYNIYIAQAYVLY